MILNNKYQVIIVKIPPDGNCLFSSIVHQLTKLDHSHEAHKDAVRILRQESVNYISANKKLYWNHILMEATAARRIEWPNTEELQKVLVDDHLRLLFKDQEWGGSEILNAVRDQYGFTIRVFSREREPLIFEGRGAETVDIFYNGIDHYDSIHEVIELDKERDQKLLDAEESGKNTVSFNYERVPNQGIYDNGNEESDDYIRRPTEARDFQESSESYNQQNSQYVNHNPMHTRDE